MPTSAYRRDFSVLPIWDDQWAACTPLLLYSFWYFHAGSRYMHFAFHQSAFTISFHNTTAPSIARNASYVLYTWFTSVMPSHAITLSATLSLMLSAWPTTAIHCFQQQLRRSPLWFLFRLWRILIKPPPPRATHLRMQSNIGLLHFENARASALRFCIIMRLYSHTPHFTYVTDIFAIW